MPRPKESQTSNFYEKILEEIGRSHKPLSAYEVKKSLDGNSDMYRMIKELCPSPTGSEERYLFDLNGVLNKKINGHLKYSLFRKLCEIFQIQAELKGTSESYNEKYSNSKIEIENKKVGRGELLTIRSETFRFHFEISLAASGSGILYLYENDNPVDFRRLRSSQGRQKLNVYCEIFTSYKHSYLSFTLSERALKDLESIKRVDPKRLQKENSIKLNRKNWKYILNLRGLLRFIFLIRLEKNRIRRIHEVLSNSSLNLESIAPFLLYWQDFETAGYKVINALVQVSSEFFEHLDQFQWNNDYLLHQVTERYYKQLSGFFRHHDHKPAYEDWKELDPETRKKLNRYRVYILNLVRGWLQKELALVNDDIEYYGKNPVLSRPI